MASWTSFLPQAQAWVSGMGFNPLVGQPHKKKRARKRHSPLGTHGKHHANRLFGTGAHGLGSPTSRGYGSVVGAAGRNKRGR